MAKESFMLVSLKEDKAKKLAQVMSNPTCTRILEYLAGKDATETQIAKDLKIPISTVHYNLQQLAQAKLVVAEEFHYSQKGREVNHYRLANKYIIIAPQEDDPSFLQHIKKYVPGFILVAGATAVLKVLQFTTRTAPAPEIMQKGVEETADVSARSMLMVADAAPEIPWWQSPNIDYFIAGAVFVLVLIIVIELINYLRNKK